MNFSNLLSTAAERLALGNSKKSFSAQYFEEKIKENYTHYWNDFLNFQIGLVLKFKQLFKNYENAMVFCVCILNQAYNMKNSKQQITGESSDKITDNYVNTITQFTLENSKGLNPTTISELTGMPRASVIRKLNDLLKEQFIIQNEQNLYTTSSAKKGSSGIKKLSKFFISNQTYIRTVIKDFLNYTII